MGIDNKQQLQFEFVINGLQQLTANIEGLNSKINSIGKDSKGRLSEEFTKVAQSAKVAGQATNELQEKYKTLQKQVQEAATAADKAWQSGTGFSGAKKDFSEALNQLVAFKKELGTLSIGQEKGIYSSLARGLDTSGTSYKILLDRIRELNNEQRELSEGTKSPRTSENTSFGILPKTTEIGRIRAEMAALQNQVIVEAQRSNGVETEKISLLRQQITERQELLALTKGAASLPTKDIITYQTQMQKLNIDAQQHYQAWKNTGSEIDRLKFERVKADMIGVNAEMNKFHAALGQSGSWIQNFQNKFRSHANWIITGGIIGGAVTAPLAMLDTYKGVEREMAGMIQVLPQLHGNQKAVNDVAMQFVGIAGQYGEKVDEVIESGKLWGRAYKDIPTIMAFTSASAKLAVADNMSLTEANKGLEATLSQYEWRARSAAEATAYSMHVVDTWTAVAHNAQVSAQDLAQANERTASVARQVGVDFEFLQAAIASGVRNTGRSGAEIGNMLKSVFGSIHSDKAVKEIENLGVKMTTVADDGTVKWRKVQDVMIDLSLATKNTKKDLEGVLKAASGGKFQWAKFNSMLDYDELMRVYGVAVKSAGFTDGQIAAQMDTLSRKIEQFKAAMTGLVTESGGSFAQAMKGYLDTLTNFVNALNSVPTQVYSFAGSIAHVTIFLWLGVRAYQAFSAAVGRSTTAKALNTIAEGANTASKSLNIRATEQGIVVEAADTAATTANTAAKAANATVTTVMTGGLNLLMGALIAGAMAFDVYSMSTGGASTANEKATKSASELAATQDKLGRQENLLQSYDQRIQYIDTLVAAHGRLKDALENEQVGSKEYEKTSESLKATEKDLADVMDTTTDSIAEDTNLRMDYIEQEKTSMTNGKESIQQSINELKQKQAELTQKTFNECKARIDDINNEAISVDKAANSIVNALGQIEGAFYKYYKGKQTYYEQTSKMMKDVEENGFGDGVLGKVAQIGYMQWQTDTGNFSSEQAEYQAKEAAGNAAKIEERAKASYESTIAGLQTSGALTAPGEGGGGTNFNTTNPGSEYDPAEKKGKKGKGSGKGREAPDWQSKLEKMQINYEVNGLFSKMKQSADDYSTSMELLNDQEKIYGSTAQSLIEKAKVQAVRMAALNKESKEAQDLADSYNSKAADMVGANQDILDSINEVTKANTEGMDLESRNAMARLQWAKLDKDTKKEILDSLKESMGEMSEGYLMLEKAISLADKAKEKANDAKKINSDVQASMYSGVFDKDKIYQRNITDINNKESIDKFGLDQRSEGYKYQTKKVEYVAELARYQQYLARRKQLQDEYNAMQQGYKDALADAQALPEGEEKIKAVKAAQEDLNNAVNDNTAGLIANKDAQGQVGVSIAESINKQKGLKDTFSDVNKQWAETTADMVVNGKNASDIMKSLWQDLAKEAIMRMFKVYTYQSQLGATAGKGKASTPVSSSGSGKGKHAMGGRFSRPHTGMVAEKGTEWIIPTENNTQDSRNMVMGAASELGMLDKGGTEVEPYLKSPQVSNSITEKTSLDNGRLETLMAAQLEHNARQTEMMSAMLNSGGNSNGGSPTIVVSRMSDEDIMKAIARNPSALQGLLNSNKQSGFR